MNPRTKERQGWQLKGNVRLKEKQQNLQKRQQQGWQWRGNVQLKQEQRNLVVVDFSTSCCMLRASTFGGVLESVLFGLCVTEKEHHACTKNNEFVGILVPIY